MENLQEISTLQDWLEESELIGWKKVNCKVQTALRNL